MWQTKGFLTYQEMDKWINTNSGKYQIRVIFVNNGYAVEYRLLRKVY